MNGDMNVERKLRHVFERSEGEAIDVTERVMERIRRHDSGRQSRTRHTAGRKLLPAAVAAALAFGVVSASASGLLDFSWEGIGISIQNDGENRYHSGDTPLVEQLEQALAAGADTWKVLEPAEFAKAADFDVIEPAPADAGLKLTQSYGVVPIDPDYRVKSSEERWLGGYYDIYEDGEDWVVARQQSDTHMTDAANGKTALSLTYGDGPWERVELSGGDFAVFVASDDGKENLLEVKKLTKDRTVVSLSFHGNISKERMIRLAESYQVK